MISAPEPIPIRYRTDLLNSFDSVVLPVDKPSGLTSFDVLRRIRRVLGKVKLGHAGTLDPMATGLLICLVGRSTKLMTHFMEMPKMYQGRIRLGERTPSFDADTPVSETVDATGIEDTLIREAATAFEGNLRQSTPMYSAVRVGGERLYKKARRGEIRETPTRDVTVYSFIPDPKEGDEFNFTLHCSMGTYVRAIANDMGERLGVGAHLVALRRTRIGDIDVSQAWDLEELVSTIRQHQDKET